MKNPANIPVTRGRQPRCNKARSIRRIGANHDNNYDVSVLNKNTNLNNDLEFILSAKQDLIKTHGFKESWLSEINDKKSIYKLLKSKNIKKVLIAKNSRYHDADAAAQAAINMICENNLLREVNGNLWESRVRQPALISLPPGVNNLNQNLNKAEDVGCGAFLGAFSFLSCRYWSGAANNTYDFMDDDINNQNI